MLGEGGMCWAYFCWGGWGQQKVCSLFPGPQGEPAHGLHPRFVVAEIWADRVEGGGGGGNSCCSL